MNRVSNVMGTTAWQVDALLTGAVQGLAGYNVHAWDEHYYPGSGWTANYTPFVVRDRQAVPRPTFYAMALLRDLGGKRLCRAMTTNNTDGAVKAWTATDPATGRLSVYLVNKSQTGRDALVVRVPGEAAGAARVSRITDAGGCAGKDTGIDGSRLPPTGSFSWTGTPVTPNVAGGYDVTLDPCQSVLLDLGAR
jgi:hypothetical protein